MGSVFYNTQSFTSTFYSRSAALFFSLLFNAFLSLLEILSIFEAKEIVQKHRIYALYRPSAEALASIIAEMPNKILLSLSFNFPIYFLINLRRNPGRFFFYWLMVFLATMTMSHMFRCLGALFSTFAQAMTFATTLLLAFVIFTGFALPIFSMLGWSRWINYLNPLGYVFESLMENEFSHREFECDQYAPSGPDYVDVPLQNRGCVAVGSKLGESKVQGSDYLSQSYDFSNAHKWRNFGINMGFVVFFLFVYLILTEFNKGKRQKGEVALYLNSSLKKKRKERLKSEADLESGIGEKADCANQTQSRGQDSSTLDAKDIVSAKEIFHWRKLTYEVKVKKGTRILLSQVDGWVEPGQVTALMGSSEAGKSTLLNCLCDRVSTGVISEGIRMVNGKSLDSSFQRSIGYCQQQDILLPTQTVRESLRFSALLRQPRNVSELEKYEYVEYILELLEMAEYADALVGEPGEGLNVEQRKRLTIGVELVAKPDLLVFFG